VVWLNPRTQGEMITHMPNSALIPDSQFICITSKANVREMETEPPCVR
jgi:hypothetical protein